MIRRWLFELRYLFGDAPWDTGISPPELIDYLRTRSPGRALDIGCGTGTNSMTMAGFGWTVLGIDISTLAIFKARRKARRSSADVRFRRGDVTQIDTGTEPYDFILDIGCFHAIPIEKQSEYLQQLIASTRPGSDYLLYTWIKSNEGDPEFAPAEADLRDRLEPTFKLLDVSYGSDHDRTSAWIFATRVD